MICVSVLLLYLQFSPLHSCCLNCHLDLPTPRSEALMNSFAQHQVLVPGTAIQAFHDWASVPFLPCTFSISMPFFFPLQPSSSFCPNSLRLYTRILSTLQGLLNTILPMDFSLTSNRWWAFLCCLWHFLSFPIHSFTYYSLSIYYVPRALIHIILLIPMVTLRNQIPYHSYNRMEGNEAMGTALSSEWQSQFSSPIPKL